MRIAITTFFQSQTNYGQLLQAFALQQALMQLGHYPYTIRYGFHEHLLPVHGLERITPDFGKLLSNMPKLKADEGTESNRHFDDFRQQHLNLSQNAYNTVEELRCYPPTADCYITGSDNVWAQLLCHENNATFFLDFGIDDVLRVAYAPSFALKAYPDEQNHLLAEHLKRFDAISTSEKTGVEICRKAGHEATWVVDPTMLLNGDYYRQLAAESTTQLPDDYALVYHVNIKKNDLLCWAQFSQYNAAHGLQTLAVYANGEEQPKEEVEFLSADATYLYPTIQDWIRLIDGSRYVLTTSYHGMLFAIMLHKPFFVSLDPQGMLADNDHITDILSELGLQDRIATSETDVDAMLQQPIDWDAVDCKLTKLREQSIGYLKQHLVEDEQWKYSHQQTKVSIIIPFYNVEGCIMRCIESVGRQTWHNLEALLIDDCSKDDSRKLIENFISHYEGDVQFRIVTQDHNQGQSVARNQGLKEATGDYIYFLDSDDYISDDCIETLCNELKRHSDLQMVIGNYEIKGPLYLASFMMQQRVYESDEIISEQLHFNIYTMPWNKLIKREFLIQNDLFFQPDIIHEDNLWSFCTAFCYDKISVVLKPTYYYVIRQGSTERSHDKAWHHQQLFQVFKYLIRFIFENNAPSKKDVKSNIEVFRFIQNSMIPFVMEPYMGGQEDLAYSHYKAIRMLPNWSKAEVEGFSGITHKEMMFYRHFDLPEEKGFKQYVKQYGSYQPQKDINTMKITVITVNYNNLDGLRRTIPSILAQTYTGYELVVVDGASTDGSKEYLQSIDRIDFLVSEPDSGVYNAMNKAVRLSHGEYCIFMNSGDTFFSATVLESVVHELNGADFYTGHSTFIDKKTTYTCFPPQEITIDFLLVNALNHQATFNRTEFLRENPYDESYRITADWGLLARKWLHDECVYESLPDMVAIYYMDGISSINKQSAENERRVQLEKLAKEMEDDEKKEKIVNAIKWYYKLQDSEPDEELLVKVLEDNKEFSREQRHKRKLVEKINKALVLSPLQRDLKIARNAIKMFFKDLF